MKKAETEIEIFQAFKKSGNESIKYEETDLKFEEPRQQIEILKVFEKSGNKSKIWGNRPIIWGKRLILVINMVYGRNGFR